MQGFRKHLGAGVAVISTILTVFPAAAGEYPVRKVRLVTPVSPGDSTERVVRLLANKLAVVFGQPVAVENAPGEEGAAAARLVAKSGADGHTLLLADARLLALDHQPIGNLDYDLKRDLVPVIYLATSPMLLLVRADHPARSAADFVSRARRGREAPRFGSQGAGSFGHLAAQLLCVLAGMDLDRAVHEPGGETFKLLSSGRISFAFEHPSRALPLVKSGQLRALAVSSATRSTMLPALPTLDEAGLSGFDAAPWIGLLAPAETARAVITKLNGDLNLVLQMQEVRETLPEHDFEPMGGLPEHFAAHIDRETIRWRRVFRESEWRSR
jgi:tripartite-type tricarboxylate transporter receptor subunit TctC